MATRTSSRTVTFGRPFVLAGFPELLPAGDYVVDTEEEELDSVLSQGWRRVSTTMRVRVDGAVEIRAVDPQALQDALSRDGARDTPGRPPARASAKPWRGTFAAHSVRRKTP